MTRFGRVLCALLVFLCAGCGAPEADELVVETNEDWLNMLCPTVDGDQTVETLLDAIIAWAADPSDAKSKAEACKLHTEANEMHCMKVVTAWTAAKQAATGVGLTQEQKDAMWLACVAELTHGTDGGGASAASVWPDVECPNLSGFTARMRLEDIIALAPPSPQIGSDARPKAIACRDMHTGVNLLHCARVYSAWTYAQATMLPLLTQGQKDALWTMCVAELTHGTDGGGVGG